MALDVEDGTLCDVDGQSEGSQDQPDDSDLQERRPGRQRRSGQRLDMEVCQLPPAASKLQHIQFHCWKHICEVPGNLHVVFCPCDYHLAYRASFVACCKCLCRVVLHLKTCRTVMERPGGKMRTHTTAGRL